MDSKIKVNIPERSYSNQEVVSLPPPRLTSASPSPQGIRSGKSKGNQWTPSSSDNDHEFSSTRSSPSVSIHSQEQNLQPTKRGVLKFDNGVYRGDIVVTPDSYSLAHGNGTYISGGETYIGQWKMGKRDGKGIKIWDDGREYSGEWSSNRRSGNGILTWKNGDVYIGEMTMGFQQGWGMLKSNGEKYVGEWNVNERHGYGSMHFKNGDLYSGEWQHNKKHGRGIYRFSDGKSVEGEWVGGVFKTQGRAKKTEEENTTSDENDSGKKLNAKEVLKASKSKKESKGGSLKHPTSKTRERSSRPSTHSPNSTEGTREGGSPSMKDFKDKIWRRRSNSSATENTKYPETNHSDASSVSVENSELFGEHTDSPSSPSNRDERKKKKSTWNFTKTST
eukprot:TRINITY_DN4799_c0_g1_i2.p1 TRINITY_DN4799_c0_g1~~TRINITY_DN4799_c0_g1_i2.p1  ORF type:complete len:391 (+),score=153.44 TRINITY_DN4799_c0_g1_i2:165-1337(+)